MHRGNDRQKIYGARYLDPKYSRWISTDPALGEYIPVAPVDEEAKRHNQNLPGMGGAFNTVNANLYHYAGNNPLYYTDPTGSDIKGMLRGAVKIDLAITEINSGMGIIAGAVAGEFISGGLSTGISIVLGTTGTFAIIDGFSRLGLGLADFTAETLDTFGKTAVDGDILPSSTGGLIGAVIDKKNGECFSDTGKIGPAQKKREKANAVFTYITSTLDYANTAKTVSNVGEVIKNEVMQQYNNYDTAKTLAD